MTTTYTTAETCTKLRIEFILNHFRSALSRLTEHTPDEIELILKGIKNEEIESLEFVGYKTENNERVVQVSLELSLDFDEHHRLNSTQPLVKYLSKYEEELSPEIYGLIVLAQNHIESNQLLSSTLFGYTKSVRKDPTKLNSVRLRYGTSPNDIKYNYSHLTQTERCQSTEAPELSSKCRL